MKLYIAAPWVHRNDAREVAKLLEAEGHVITHKWWDVEGEYDDHEKTTECAFDDYEGVYNADRLVLLDTQKSEGKAVEQGLALGFGIPIIAIGRRGEHSQNVFHHLPNYTWVETLNEAIIKLEEANL